MQTTPDNQANPRLRAVLLAVSLLLCSSVCMASGTTVEIGAEDDWLPHSGVINGQPQGLAEDIVRAAYQAVGIQVNFLPLPYSRCMAKTEAGTLLACFNAARSSLREHYFYWTKMPLFTAQVDIYVRNDSKAQGLRAEDLEGKQVEVTNGYEYGESFDSNNKIIRSVSNQDIQAIRKLLAKRIDYIMLYQRIANYLQKIHPDIRGKFKSVGTTDTPQLYMVFSKSYPHSQALMDQYNRGFAIITSNGSYQKILNKWE